MLIPILWSSPLRFGFMDVTSKAFGGWAWATRRDTPSAVHKLCVHFMRVYWQPKEWLRAKCSRHFILSTD